MHESYYINDCISRIESRLDWGPSQHWTSYHFAKLSTDIHAVTGKNLSDSTLKRFFGKKDPKNNYIPQIYTRDAIAEYLGFQDWDSFKSQWKSNRETKPKPSGPTIKNRKYHWKVLFAGGFALCLLILVFKLFQNQAATAAWIRTSDTCMTVPYTATFHYDVSKCSDSVFIDFGNDSHDYLPKDKHSISEFYKAAGIYEVKIHTHKEVLDSVRLTNYSKGWQCGCSPNDFYKKYIPLEDQNLIEKTGRLYLAPEKGCAQVSGSTTGYYTEYRLVKDFNANLDDLSFSTVVCNNSEDGGKLCYDIEIWLLGTLNNFRVRFVQPGCYRYGQLQISEKNYSGRYDDLTPFARDISRWKSIKISTHRHNARIMFENDTIFKEKYQKPMGNLQAVYYRFYGTGSVRETRLSDPSGKTIFQDLFNGVDND